ncbi:phospholipase-like protein [Tanacetum coccineum]
MAANNKTDRTLAVQTKPKAPMAMAAARGGGDGDEMVEVMVSVVMHGGCHGEAAAAVAVMAWGCRYPRVAALRKKKGRFTSEMVFGFFQRNIPVARLTPDDIEARSDWWISSKAYFDRFIDQFVEQKIELESTKKDVHDIKEEMDKFRQEMNARSVRQENTVPIIVGQHYGLSDFSEFRSMQGGPSVIPWNVGTDAELATSHYWQPSSHPGSYNSFARVPSHMGRQNLQTTIDTQHDVDGIVQQNIPNRGKRQQLPSKYLVNYITGYNEEENNIKFLGSQFTGNILFYENVDPAKVRRENYENVLHFLNNPYPIYLDCYMRGYIVPVTFWQELAPHLCRTDMQSISYGIPIGWLSGEHMNSWMEQLIRRRPLNANWTVAYTSTISVHPENNQFIIVNDPHVIGTLDGSTRPYPSWNDVDWVFLPIHVAGNHWATGVIDLANKARNTK